MKQTFKINGMSCGSCKQTVGKALQGVNGVTSVQVSLNPPQAIIEKADAVTLVQLNSVLSKAGNYSIGEVILSPIILGIMSYGIPKREKYSQRNAYDDIYT